MLTSSQAEKTATLYEQMGGFKGISSIVDAIVDAHMNNPVIRARFTPYQQDQDRMQVIKKHLTHFLCMGTGGQEIYTGRDMPSAHRGMNISNEEFVAALDDIMMVLDRFQVSDSVKKEILYVSYSMKNDIVRL